MNRGESNRRSINVDDRNYAAEAQDLIKGLRPNELYSLFEIVLKEQRKSGSDERHKELAAVKEAIRSSSKVEEGRIFRLERGRSEMAETARSKDGQTDKHRKKV